MRFVFIQAHARIWRVTTMCRVLEVSRAGYYAWRARPLCDRVKDDRVLADKIREIQKQVKQRYGSPRTWQELRALGFTCGENRVARVMRQAGIRAKSARKFRVTTQSEHEQPIARNVLDRQFAVEAHRRPDRTWVADITDIPTREGWLYLAVILDLATRRVVGWALRTRLEQELALAALRMALLHRGARGGLHRLRSRRAVRQRRVSTITEGSWLHREHESCRRLLGQRRGRELLRDAHEGVAHRWRLRQPGAGKP
jgi:putative transposase